LEKRRNYRQFCGLARALDRLGERWTLLIVRNLLLGPKRYSDLLEGLPGITTNLLALRLKEMEQAGLVVRRPAEPPVRAHLYELGEQGRALEPAIMELARWGGRFMTSGPGEDDTLNIGWGLLALKRRYRGGLSLVAEIRVGARAFELVFEPGYLGVSERAAARPDIVVAGDMDDVRAWLFLGARGDELRHARRLSVRGSDEHWAALCAAFAPREAWPEELLEKRRGAGANPFSG
jgi:DNA-binding HxlR family transcriptional regulator